MHRDRVVVVRNPGLLSPFSTHTLCVASRSGLALAGFRCRDSRLRCRIAPRHSEVGIVVLGIHSGDIAHDGLESVRDERNADALVLPEVVELAKAAVLKRDAGGVRAGVQLEWDRVAEDVGCRRGPDSQCHATSAS